MQIEGSSNNSALANASRSGNLAQRSRNTQPKLGRWSIKL